MAKIAMIGAGGVIFAQNFIKDILLDGLLRQSEVTLMDIDRERLENAGKWRKSCLHSSVWRSNRN